MKSNDTISCFCHRGICGAIHLYELSKEYDVSVLFECGEDIFYLKSSPAKSINDAENNWKSVIDSFFLRHPECKKVMPNS